MIDKLIKEFPRALVISTFVFIILLLLKIVTGVAIQINSSLVVFYLYTTLYSFSLYYANAFLFIGLDEQFVHNRFSAQRIGFGLLFSFLISTLIIFLLRIFEDVIIEGESWSSFISNENGFDYLISIAMTFFVTLIFHVFYFYQSFQENKVKEQQLIATTANAQFESLKNQIDPLIECDVKNKTISSKIFEDNFHLRIQEIIQQF